MEEHSLRERDIQSKVEKERRDFEANVLRKAEQLISEYKDAASKAAEKAPDEIRENRAREMELMHQAELNRIEFEQAVKSEADKKIAELREHCNREAELKAEQLRGAMEQREFELLQKMEAEKSKFEQGLSSKSNDTVAHFKEIAQKAVQHADAERAAFQTRDLEIQKARRQKYEGEAEDRAQGATQEYKDKLREAQSNSKDANTLLHTSRMDNEREFDRRKTTYEEDVAAKAQARIAQYKKAATDAEDKLNDYRIQSQQEDAERLRQNEASRIAEKEINDRSAQIIKEYKDMAESALAKVEQERLALNEREMELQRQADQVVLKRERELTDQFDEFKATFESEMRRRADDMIAEYTEKAAKSSKLESERQRFNMSSNEQERKFESSRNEYTERADSQVDAAREQAVNAERAIEQLRAEFSDKQADIETQVEDRVEMLLEEHKTAARNAKTKLATREREWEQLEVSLRAHIEEAKRESQNAADAVVGQYKVAAHLAERLAAQARELEEARKALSRQEYVVNKSNEIVETAKDDVRALKLQLQKEQTAFADRERQLSLDSERARQAQEQEAAKRANEQISKYQTEVKESIERARQEREQQAGELQRKSEEMVLQYQKIAQEATSLLDTEKEATQIKDAEMSKKYEMQRIEFEADCRRKADGIVKEHLEAAQRTKEAAEVARREAQQMLWEAQQAAEAGRQAFEAQLRAKANEMAGEYKRIAKEATEKAEQEHVGMQKREMEIIREAELGKQSYESEGQHKANELVEQYRNMAAKAREEVEREKSVMQEQVRSAQKDMEMKRQSFEEEVTRHATSRIKESEDEAKGARAEHEEERSRLKILEMDMAKELEVRQTAFESEVRMKANEAVDVFKKLAEEAQEKAEAERSARTTRELDLTARLEYKKRATAAEHSREQAISAEVAKNDADMSDFRRTIDDEMKARETQLIARMAQHQQELDQKTRAVDDQRVAMTAEKRAIEDQLNHKFAAKSREVESSSKAEVAEAKRLMEQEKGRLEAELEQKKRDMEAAMSAYEASLRERYAVQQKSVEEGLARRSQDEKAAFEADRERLASELRVTIDKMETEKRCHEDEVKERYSQTLKEVEDRFIEEKARLESSVLKASTDATRDIKDKESKMELDPAQYEKSVRDKYQARDQISSNETVKENERSKMASEAARTEERFNKLQVEFESKTRSKTVTEDSAVPVLESSYNEIRAMCEASQAEELELKRVADNEAERIALAQVDEEATDEDGQTALHGAAEEGQDEMGATFQKLRHENELLHAQVNQLNEHLQVTVNKRRLEFEVASSAGAASVATATAGQGMAQPVQVVQASATPAEEFRGLVANNERTRDHITDLEEELAQTAANKEVNGSITEEELHHAEKAELVDEIEDKLREAQTAKFSASLMMTTSAGLASSGAGPPSSAAAPRRGGGGGGSGAATRGGAKRAGKNRGGSRHGMAPLALVLVIMMAGPTAATGGIPSTRFPPPSPPFQL